MDRSSVFDDEWITEPSGLPKVPDFFGGFARAGDDRNLFALQPSQGLGSWFPAVVVVQQRPVQVRDDPPGLGLTHRLLIQ
jgi:hypothetical protein